MILLMFLLSFILFHAPSCQAGDPCPNTTDFAPCTCSQTLVVKEGSKEAKTETKLIPRRKRAFIDNSNMTPEIPMESSLYTVVKCQEFKSPNIMEDTISSGLNRKWVDKLILTSIPPEKRNTLARLPGDCLKNVRIRELEIQNTLLSGDFAWKEHPLRDQAESLYWLTVNNCFLSGVLSYEDDGAVHTRGLNELHRLQGLDLSSNHLTHIWPSAFKSPPRNLSTIVLARNSIQAIVGNAFSPIPLLKHVDLSHNQLTSIGHFLGEPEYLEFIDLSWNSIRSLPTDFFEDMPALKYVNVSNNFLHSIPDNPWSEVWKQLLHIDISGNFVECNCDFLWILPILLTNSTVPSAQPGQTVVGRCAQPLKQQDLQPLHHNFTSLTRDRLNC